MVGSIVVIASLILLVVMQRAQLVKYQYQLVDARVERAKVLKQRDELKLTIQRLSALERVDTMSHKHLQMARPIRRRVLDMSMYHIAPPPAHVSTSTTPTDAAAFDADLNGRGASNETTPKDEEGTP